MSVSLKDGSSLVFTNGNFSFDIGEQANAFMIEESGRAFALGGRTHLEMVTALRRLMKLFDAAVDK